MVSPGTSSTLLICIDNQVSYCSSVSFACGTLRMQVIDNKGHTLNMRDVVCTEKLVSSLLPHQWNDTFSVTHNTNWVSIKMHSDKADGAIGARITIGKNGGMQYLGRMDQVSLSRGSLLHAFLCCTLCVWISSWDEKHSMKNSGSSF